MQTILMYGVLNSRHRDFTEQVHLYSLTPLSYVALRPDTVYHIASVNMGTIIVKKIT